MNTKKVLSNNNISETTKTSSSSTSKVNKRKSSRSPRDYLKTTHSKKRKRVLPSRKYSKKNVTGGASIIKGLKRAASSLKRKTSRLAKSAVKTASTLKRRARGTAEAMIKAPQIATRMGEIGAVFGFLPTSGEVLGNNLTNVTEGPRFNQDLYMNMKANLCALACADHLTLCKMLLVNPADIADYARLQRHLRKKAASCNVVADERQLNLRNKRGLKVSERLEKLKRDMKLTCNNSAVTDTENNAAYSNYRSYQTFDPEKEINMVLQRDMDKSLFKEADYQKADYESTEGKSVLGKVGTFVSNRVKGAKTLVSNIREGARAAVLSTEAEAKDLAAREGISFEEAQKRLAERKASEQSE